jgi:phenylalanyl-tRNA synthetase beta subunit
MILHMLSVDVGGEQLQIVCRAPNARKDMKCPVAYNLYFRSPDRTLRDSDIKTSMNRVVETLSKELSEQLR